MFFNFLVKVNLAFVFCSVVVLGSSSLPDNDLESLEANRLNNNLLIMQTPHQPEARVFETDRFLEVEAGFADNLTTQSDQSTQRAALARRFLNGAGNFVVKVVNNTIVALVVLTVLKLLGIDVMEALQHDCD